MKVLHNIEHLLPEEIEKRSFEIISEELKQRGIKKLKVLYSKEEPIKQETNEGERRTPGSISFVPSVAGLIIAGEVIKDLIK